MWMLVAALAWSADVAMDNGKAVIVRPEASERVVLVGPEGKPTEQARALGLDKYLVVDPELWLDVTSEAARIPAFEAALEAAKAVAADERTLRMDAEQRAGEAEARASIAENEARRGRGRAAVTALAVGGVAGTVGAVSGLLLGLILAQ